MRIKGSETQAMIIDMQERLIPAMKDGNEVVERAVMLAKGLKILGIPLLITQQYTKGLGSSMPEIYEAAGTREYFDKHAFSCVKDEKIFEELKSRNRKNVIIAGVELHVCVLQTCIDLKAEGFEPVLVLDCCASRKKADMKAAVNRAIQEGITVTTAESILFEILEDSKNPGFKEISNLVK